MTLSKEEAEELLKHLRIKLERAHEDRLQAEHSARLILETIQKLRREHKI